jgi:hypothetical protein
MQAKITINSDNGTYTHTKGSWSGTFPIAEMQSWLSFYRTQVQRYPTRAAIYEIDIRALETALDQAEGAGSSSAGSESSA